MLVLKHSAWSEFFLVFDLREKILFIFYFSTEEHFPGFNLHIAGPIISILMNERNSVIVEASTQFNDESGGKGILSIFFAK